MSHRPDEDWRAMRAGEHAALERLYRAHAPELLRYGRRLAAPAQVQDALHDLFVRVWERRGGLDADVNPRAYLLVSLRHALVRGTRRARKHVTPDGLHAAADDPNAEQRLVDAERAGARAEALGHALATLSARERELVELRFYQGLDYDDVCAVTGITYQSARNTLARAVAKLRGRLNSS